ncbi:hypothetical protein EJ08DRAFT_587523 [Tothia fuscella]|uniref:Xaa-Pro aminopeptidase n=1 Tax=Tothia fuscella TaxID=1048955 RepID=A0A9P4NU59_9PEZI|nr:hypothetical protein EJ08DRAFT_587523 [Tothia fuscella]
MDRLDLRCLAKRLEGESQVYSFHINSRTSPNKYPAKQHARAVANRLEVTEGLIYLAGAPTAFLEDSDQSAPFRQRRYFFYFSGCDEADCHILYDISKDKLVLYIPEIDARKAVWGGAGSTKPEAEAKYDADGVKYTSHLKDDVKKWWNKGSGRLYLLHPDQTVTPYCLDSETLDVGRIDALLLRYTTDLCRVIKDDHEIKLIRRANEVSAHAHRAVLKNIHSFQNESQVEAIFLDTSISEGAKHQAYSIIAGSGMNAAVLHYVNNNEPLADRQLLLIDAGAEWDCYASDVTRTFPISGKWTKEAKDIYDLVDEMQTACMTRMKPGTHFRDLQVLAHFIAVTGLMKLGILHNGTRDEILAAGTSTAFFPHGLGHHVGLEVHDVIDLPFTMATGEHFSQSEFPTGDPSLLAQLYQTLIDPSLCKGPLLRQGTGLQEGMIVTVEPGIYFSQYALTRVFLPNPVHARYINKQVLAKYMLVGGVRIEDDILITRDGYENLTTAPKGDEALKIIRGDRVPSNADLDTSYGEDSIHIPSMTLEDLDTYSRVFRQLSSKEDSGLIQGIFSEAKT